MAEISLRVDELEWLSLTVPAGSVAGERRYHKRGMVPING